MACFCKLMAWKISLSCAHGTDLGDVFNLPFLSNHATTDVSVWMSWAYLAWQFWESLLLTEFRPLLQVHQLLSVFQQADQGLLNLNWIAIFLSYYRIYENGVLSIPFRQVTPPPCHIQLSVNILIMDCNTKLLYNQSLPCSLQIWLWRVSDCEELVG